MKPAFIITSLALCASFIFFSGQTIPASGTASPRLEPFGNLPAPTTSPIASSRVNAGTPGKPVALTASASGRSTLALIGDIAPGAEREKFLALTVGQLNILRPDAVLTVGNLIPGITRNGSRYVVELTAARGALDELKMSWLPCVGANEVVSGTRMPGSVGGSDGDRRFEELYKRYVGPLYFSADVGTEGAVHAVVLDSEEGVGGGNTISDEQLQWLRQDLNHTFDIGRAQWIVLVLHRPLWREAGGNWGKVHDLLAAFNHRPTASVEGLTPANGSGHGLRVVGVFASGAGVYGQDPSRDGIHYVAVGPSAAEPGAGEGFRHVTLLNFEGGDVRVGLMRLDAPAGAPPLLPEDVVNGKERGMLDAIAAWGESVIGVDGVVDERGEPIGGGGAGGKRLVFRAANPLTEAVDVQMKISPGSNWDFVSVPLQRYLLAGGSTAFEFSLRRIKAGIDRPVLQAAVYWNDGRGRRHEVLLRRGVTVSPGVEITQSDKAMAIDAKEGWVSAGVVSAWGPASDAPRKADPTIEMAADADHILIRVHVTDGVRSYWPVMKLLPQMGGIASDAISVTFAREGVVQRLWLLPFAPKGMELWSNSGLGVKQTDLQKVDEKWGVQFGISSDATGYVATVSVPRKLLGLEAPVVAAVQNGQFPPVIQFPPILQLPGIGPGAPRVVVGAQLNVSVHDNDEGGRTWVKSWGNEEAGPAGWGRVQVVIPAPVVPGGFHLP